MRKAVTAILALMFLAGCATTYTKKSLLGGYSDTKIQEDIFKVTFKGNAYTDTERTEDFTLLRCAEITLENGYNYFIVLGGGTDVKTGTVYTPPTAQTTGFVSGGVYHGHTSYFGGGVSAYHKPTSACMIKCFKERPEDLNVIVLDATQVRDNIKAKYKIENKENRP